MNGERGTRRCLIKKVMIEKTTGNKPLGRSHQRWIDIMKRDLTSINPTLSFSMTTNGNHWRGIVEATKNLNVLF